MLFLLPACIYSFRVGLRCTREGMITHTHARKGRLGMSEISSLSGISGLSFDSSFLYSLSFSLSLFPPSPLTRSVLSFSHKISQTLFVKS